MSQELQKQQQLHELLGIPLATLNLFGPVQQGWLQMSITKTKVFESLAANELIVQQKLLDIEKECSLKENETVESANTRLTGVQSRIKEAVSVYDTAKAERLYFTGLIEEKLIQPAMQYEKRNLVLIDNAKKHELSFREVVVKKQNEGASKALEIEQLKAHIKNEHYRIAAQYRLDCAQIIVDGYINALKQKQTKEQLPAYIKSIEKFVREVQLSPFNRFNRILIDDKEAMAIFKELPAYDPAEDLKTLLETIPDKFAMYDQDLKNTEEAVKATQQQQNQLKKEINDDVIQETATNNLVSKSTSMSISGGAKLKTKMDVVEENNSEWALHVIKAFQKNWNECWKLLKVKTWSKLSLAQMATALGALATQNGNTSIEPGKVYDGLTLEVIKK
jgi:hypothetical protein